MAILEIRQPESDLEKRLLKEQVVVQYTSAEGNVTEEISQQLGYKAIIPFEFRVYESIRIKSKYLNEEQEGLFRNEGLLAIGKLQYLQADSERYARNHLKERFGDRLVGVIIKNKKDPQIEMLNPTVKSDNLVYSANEGDILVGYVGLTLIGHAFLKE